MQLIPNRFSIRALRPLAAMASLLVGWTAFAATDSEPILIDFGRHDGGNGAATTNADANGNYWNSWSPGTGTVPVNSVLTNMVTVSNHVSTVAITATTSAWQNNGYLNGGLKTPSAALLGDFAIGTATGDYFFVNNASGTLRLAGLNPERLYKLRMYGVRITDASTTRTSRYSVTDANGTHTVDLQTSGPGSGSAANPYGNDDTIVELDQLIPNAAGQLDLGVTIVNGSFAYIGILKIVPLAPTLAFLQSPLSLEVAAGTSTSLTAAATSPLPINYQWYFTNSPIPGATSSNLPLPNVTAATVGRYFVTASNSFGSVTSAVATVTLGPDHFTGFSVLVDFGRNDGGVNGIETASPDAYGHYWNNLGISSGTIPQGFSLGGLVTMSNQPTTIGITTVTGNFQCNGIQNGGLLAPHYGLLGDYAIPTATEDYWFLNNGSPGIAGTLAITGLDPGTTYKLKMFATRNIADTRITSYSVTDSNGLHYVTLQTSGTGAGSTNQPTGNDATVVSLNGLVPDPSGELDLTVTEVAGLYAYLGILEITLADPLPSFALQPQSLEVAPGASSALIAYAVSTQPIGYQWYFQNSPIPGATGTNLPLPGIAGTNVGSYFLVASNILGVVTSSVATVLLGPPHLPTSSVLLDFSRNDRANGIDTSSPDVNGNYWNNLGVTTGTVPEGLAIANLVAIDGSPTPIGLTVVSTNFQCNGTQNGGLLTPHYALLGDFAVGTATEDYFFLNNGSAGISGTLAITGLDPTKKYNLSLFATRNTSATDTRISNYSVTDSNGLHSVNLQTSGPGAGSTNYPYGNDHNIVSLNQLVPDATGELDLTVAEASGLFAYLGILQIVPGAESTFAAPTPIAGGWRLGFAATPGYTYRVERAHDVAGPWTPLGTVLCPSSGLCTFDDVNAPTGRAFYRTVVP